MGRRAEANLLSPHYLSVYECRSRDCSCCTDWTGRRWGEQGWRQRVVSAPQFHEKVMY